MTTSALGEEGFDSQARVVEECAGGACRKGGQLLLKENPKQDWRQRSPAFFARISARSAGAVGWTDGIPGKEVIARRQRRACHHLGDGGLGGGIRMGKPVVLLGRAWYAGFDGVHVTAGTPGCPLDGS
jgi:hypothetical protein